MKSKLNTILIVFSIIPFVITITLFFYGKKDQSARLSNIQSNAKSGSEVITFLLHTQEKELSLLAKQNEIVNFCYNSWSPDKTDYSILYQNSQTALQQKLRLNQYYKVLTIYDKYGAIINSTNEQEINQNNRTHPIIQQISRTKEPSSI